MKKGIIMEKNQKCMIVMTPDGLFQKAQPMENAAIGSEVFFQPIELSTSHTFFWRLKNMMTMPKSLFSTICLLLILISPFYFIPKNSETYAYVSVDINPSLTIEIDKKTHVNNITAINEDATTVINQLEKVKGKSLESVLSQIITKTEAEGLTKNGKNMLIGVSYTDANHGHPIKVKEMSLSSDWEVVEITIPEEIKKVADEKHMSMNELMIDSVEGNPEQLDDVNLKERELIHLFYNNIFHPHDQSSSLEYLKDSYQQQGFPNHSPIEKEWPLGKIKDE